MFRLISRKGLMLENTGAAVNDSGTTSRRGTERVKVVGGGGKCDLGFVGVLFRARLYRHELAPRDPQSLVVVEEQLDPCDAVI